jgi:two-component system sensor histidine kinase DesK
MNERMSDADFRKSIGLHWLWVPLSFVWLATLFGPVMDLFGNDRSPIAAVLGVVGIVLFIGLDVWMGAHNVAKRQPEPLGSWRLWLPPVAIAALALGLVLAFGKDWTPVFFFTAAAIAIYLPAALVLRPLVVLAVLEVPVCWAVGMAWGDIAGTVVFSGAIAMTMFSLIGVGVANRELTRAREELARLAVTEERLRFARDLHDLLGHSLSLIALKSELAGRLIGVAPERAETDIRDVEAVARKALAEVREAVAGYRQPALDDELRGAGEMPSAAGIRLEVERAPLVVPAVVEAALAWTVREGVTNVIRHSRARVCTITIRSDGDGIGVEVGDDGIGVEGFELRASSLETGASGSGLAGLAERIGALGGRFEAGPRAEGGFRLAVWVPVRENGGPSGSPNTQRVSGGGEGAFAERELVGRP